MAQADDSGPSNGEGLLKRKAISEIRLQDPKLWSKIIWIRKNFVNDDTSGVRKVDFYNFVTEHLGRTGYRDVWHLLKMAYPHVDRVRRGRKYMYWGIRHVDKLKSLSSLDDERQEGDQRQQKSRTGVECETRTKRVLEDKQEKTKSKALGSRSRDECNNNRLQLIRKSDSKLATGEISFSKAVHDGTERPGKQSPKEDKLYSKNEHRRSQSWVVVKTEHVSDDEDKVEATKGEDVVVMEFKEKDVFESFEDYEKSKSLEETEHKETNTKSGSRREVSRSVSPPVEIFSENQISPELSPSKQFAYLNSSKSEDEKRLHGNSGDSTAEQENVFSKFDKELVDKNDSGINDLFAPNLLEPENINRVCIPLIHDVRKRPTRKSTRNSKASDAEKKEDTNGNVEGFTTTTTGSSVGVVNTSVTTSNAVVPISTDKSQSSFDPVIVSVASIVGMKESTNRKETRGTLTTHLQSSNGITSSWVESSRGRDNGSLSSSQSEQSSTGDTQVVVVQDRGTQVCERPKDTNQRAKRTIQQSTSTDSNRHLGAQNSSTHNVSLNRVPIANQNQIVSVNPSTQNQDESSIRKKLKPNGSAVTKDIYPNPSLIVQPVVSKGVGQRPNVRSPTVNIVRLPGVPAYKDELPSANASRAIPVNAGNYHVGTTNQGTTVIGENRAALPQQRVIFFTSPPTSANSIGANSTSKIQIAPSPNVATTFLSSGKPHLERKDVTTSKTVFYPMSTLIKQNQTLNTKRSRPDENSKPKVIYESAARLDPAGLGTHTGMVDGGPERPKSSDETLRNREMIRKLLEEHENKTRSTTYSPNSDLQVMVDCLSSELEKERTMRLRLEIELRKVENQLDQERKLNERLAALLMKR